MRLGNQLIKMLAKQKLYDLLALLTGPAWTQGATGSSSCTVRPGWAWVWPPNPSWPLSRSLAALCDMHPMRALFLIPRNPAPRLKSKKW